MPIDEDYGSLEIPRESVSHFKGHNDVVLVCAFNPTGTILKAIISLIARSLMYNFDV